MNTNNPPVQLEDLQSLLDNQPQDQGKAFDFHYYIDLLLRRRWFLLVSFLIAIITGIYLAVTLPKIYQSETLIMIEPQRLPDNYVRPIVSGDLGARISTVNEFIKSRSNLSIIMKNFNLLSGPEFENMYLDKKIELLRARTSVSLNNYANSFTISFVAEDPEVAMQVVKTMATLVIDQNMQVRESQAVGAVDFLDSELINMRQKLEAVETALKDFRMKHMGELPEQLDSNQRALGQLQQRLSDQERSLRDERNRLASIDNQLQLLYEQAAITVATSPPAENGEPTTLEGLKQQLAEYKTRYTPQHPDVIMLQRKIEELEQQLPPPASKSGGSDLTRAPGAASQAIRPSRMEADLINQRIGIQREIGAIKDEMLSLKEKINDYQTRIENTPKLEQELISLNRDYGNIQNTYRSLLDRKQEAKIATNMERQQKGEQFRILDPARLPDKPHSPNMRKLFLLFVMGGLGLGCGIIFALDYFDNSVKKLENVPDKLGIPLLLAMPSVKRPKDIRRRHINDGISILVATVCLALLALFTAVSVLDLRGPTEIVKNILT